MRQPDSPPDASVPTPALRRSFPPLPPFPLPGLTDGFVTVRLWDPPQHAAGRLRLLRDPDQDRWGVPVFVPRPVDVAAEQEHLERDLAKAISGQPSSYAVVAAETGTLLGDVACRLDLPLLGIADVGYGTLPEARGRGVATAALGLLTAWLTDPVDGCGLERVQLDHAVANAASCRVALRAGFVKEGVRRGFLPVVDPGTPAGWSRADVCLHGWVGSG